MENRESEIWGEEDIFSEQGEGLEEEKKNPEEERVIEMVENSGFKGLIEKISKEHCLDSFEQKSDVPIPIEKMSESSLVLEISSEIKKELNAFLEKINEEETAKEYPFLLLGRVLSNSEGEKYVSIEKIKDLYNSELELENDIVFLDGRMLGGSILEAANDGSDVFVLCHTHPRASEETRKKLLTEKISHETREKFGIREAGLNFSVQDLYQLYEFEKQLKKQSKSYNLPDNCLFALGVLMFNGEMHIVNMEDDFFRKNTYLDNS